MTFLKHVLSKSWELSATQFISILAFANLLVYHYPLYLFAVDNLDIYTMNGLLTLFSVSVIIFTFTALALFLLWVISSWVAWSFLLVIILLNAVALYFMVTYQVVFDKTMIANIFNTRTSESGHYFHPKQFIYLLVFAVIPIWLVLKCQIKKASRLRLVFHAFISLLISLVFIYANASTSLWIDKHASKLGSRVLPWSYLINLAKFQIAENAVPQVQQLLPAANFSSDKSVVVLVIGETARAQNFSLYGYDRLTNPLLSKVDLVVLNDTTACSTYTTASIRCMLSHTDTDMAAFEPLPSYLNRQGVDVIWHSNNWGEPKISVRNYNDSEALMPLCKTDHCEFDEILLSGLKQRIESSDKNKILVLLHASGSHGPSYYRKYPPEFEVFKPACKTVALNECTPQALINAYDNSILYTDYFLAKLIGLLQTIPDAPIAMMYVSDHGESLGEYGLYLHGTPFSIAPDVQKKVPFLVWMSKAFKATKKLSVASFKQQATHSHHQIFHSVMGALSIKSSVYKKELDVFWQTHQE